MLIKKSIKGTFYSPSYYIILPLHYIHLYDIILCCASYLKSITASTFSSYSFTQEYVIEIAAELQSISVYFRLSLYKTSRKNQLVIVH